MDFKTLYSKIRYEFFDAMKIDDSKLYDDKISYITKSLLDLSKPVIPPLGSDYTYILRMHYGILNNGKKETLNFIGNIIGMTREGIRQILIRSKRELFLYIYNSSKVRKRISTLELDSMYSELKNYPAVYFINDSRIYRAFNKNNIYTLEDLLSYSSEELKICGIGEGSLSKVIKNIHLNGYRFIDELTKEEKRMLIYKSDINKLLNSSPWLISGFEELKYGIKLKFNSRFNTIMNLMSIVNSDEYEISYIVINELISLGLSVDSSIIIKSNLTKAKYMSNIVNDVIKQGCNLSDILNLDCLALNIRNSTKKILFMAGIEKIGDLINYRITDLNRIKNLDQVRLNEVIRNIHSLGLLFRDEAIHMKVYSTSLYKEVSKEKVKTNN